MSVILKSGSDSKIFFGGKKKVIYLSTFKNMEDILHECKCACLGINIFRRLTTVDPRSEVATDERDEIVCRLLGILYLFIYSLKKIVNKVIIICLKK